MAFRIRSVVLSAVLLLLASATLSAAEVGDARSFWVEDLGAAGGAATHIEVDTTLRAVGEHVDLYVADDVWPVILSEDERDRVMTPMETETPLGDGVGAYERCVALFGAPSDVDQDGKVLLVAYAFTTTNHDTFSARFEPYDVTDPFVVECVNLADTPCSNEAEVIFVDADPAGSTIMVGKMLAELQRIIHLEADADEGAWLVALMGELAKTATGCGDGPAVNGYLEDHVLPLMDEDNYDLGALGLFGIYLLERFGEDWVRGVVADPANGPDSVVSAIEAAESGLSFATLFGDWVGRTLTAMPNCGGAPFANLTLGVEAQDPADEDATVWVAHEPDAAFPVPTAESPRATADFVIGATSWRWLGGTLSVPGADSLTVRVDSEAAIELRVYTLRGAGEATTTTQLAADDDGAVLLDGDALWQRVIVAVANPTTASATVTLAATFDPEGGDEPEPVVEPGGGVDVPVVSQDVVEDLASAADTGGDEPVSKGGGGSCSAAGPGAVPLPLLLLAFGLAVLSGSRRGRRRFGGRDRRP